MRFAEGEPVEAVARLGLDGAFALARSAQGGLNLILVIERRVLGVVVKVVALGVEEAATGTDWYGPPGLRLRKSDIRSAFGESEGSGSSE